MSDDERHDLDAPTPPGGPLRRDAPDGPDTPGTPGAGPGPEPPEPGGPGPGASEPEQSATQADLQVENAETSLDQPSQ